MGGSNPEQSSPSFFKILLDASASKLPLPPAFAKKHFSKGNFPENALLITKSGKSWDVTIGEINGKYCFMYGWMKFVKDNKLESGDFLVFWMVGDYAFQVAMYGPSCCEKDSSPAFSTNCVSKNNRSRSTTVHVKNPVKVEDESEEVIGTNTVHVKNPVKVEDEGEDVTETEGSEKEKPMNPSFQKVLTKYHKNSMRLPRKFERDCGIGSRRGMVLRDGEGRKWAVRLAVKSDSRLYMCSGWPHFHKENNLMDGDTCVFKFLRSEGNLIHIQVMKEAKRKRGRPPLQKKP